MYAYHGLANNFIPLSEYITNEHLFLRREIFVSIYYDSPYLPWYLEFAL